MADESALSGFQVVRVIDGTATGTVTNPNTDNSYSGNVAVLGEAAVGGTNYGTLTAALTAAADGDTVTLLADVTDDSEEGIKVNPGVTLDLNGKTLTVTKGVVATGTIIDSSKDGAGGDGLLKVAADKVELNSTNTQLPIYDTRDGANGYWFYQYTFTKYSGVLVSKDQTMVRFYYQMLCENEDACELLMKTTDDQVDVYAKLSAEGTDASKISFLGEIKFSDTALADMSSPIVSNVANKNDCGVFPQVTGFTDL